MVSYFVRYRGSSPDPDAFQTYYETRHAETLRRFPGIRSLMLHRPATWTDPFPVRPGGTLLLAQMTFDSATDLQLRCIRRRGARHARIFTASRGSTARSRTKRCRGNWYSDE